MASERRFAHPNAKPDTRYRHGFRRTATVHLSSSAVAVRRGGNRYEVWWRHVLSQHQSPLAIGRKRARRPLSKTDGGSAIRIASENRILATTGLARLHK